MSEIDFNEHTLDNSTSSEKTYSVEELHAFSEVLLSNGVYGSETQVLEECSELVGLAVACGFEDRIRQLEIQGSVPSMLVLIEGDIEGLKKNDPAANNQAKWGRISHFRRAEKGAAGEHLELDFDPKEVPEYAGLVEFFDAQNIEQDPMGNWVISLETASA